LAVIAFPKPECRLWQVSSWRPGPVIPLSTAFFGAMAFARDGRLLALDDGGRVRLVDPGSGQAIATLDTGTGSSDHFHCLAFSPDGSHLAAGQGHIIHLWDLRRIRAGLAAIGLDWDRPAYPPPAPGAREAGPLSVVIDAGS
jgi:WD40 repeat protein